MQRKWETQSALAVHRYGAAPHYPVTSSWMLDFGQTIRSRGIVILRRTELTDAPTIWRVHSAT